MQQGQCAVSGVSPQKYNYTFETQHGDQPGLLLILIPGVYVIFNALCALLLIDYMVSEFYFQ